MDVLEEYKEIINSDERRFKIDTVHGVDIIDNIIYPFLDSHGEENVTIIATGREARRQLDSEMIEYKKSTDYFELVDVKDGNPEFDIVDRHEICDVVIVWPSNYMQLYFMNKLASYLSANLVAVGDSFLVDYFSDGDVIQFLHDPHLVIDRIDNLKGYSQELLYFVNRVRNGEIDQLEDVKNRSYEISSKKPSLDELFEYDTVVTSNFCVGETNRYIRESIFKRDNLIPVKGDRMMSYELIQTTDIDNEKIIIEFGEELKVLDVTLQSNHNLIVLFETEDGREVNLWLNLPWLARRYGEDDVEYNRGGHKIFYSYVVPPEAVIDNSYESIFFEMKSENINNKRVLYSVASSARQELKIVYDTDLNYVY